LQNNLGLNLHEYFEQRSREGRDGQNIASPVENQMVDFQQYLDKRQKMESQQVVQEPLQHIPK